MLVNYPLELQEKTSVYIKIKTPLTNLLILNIKYTDQIRENILKNNNHLVDDWPMTYDEILKWSAYIHILNLRKPAWFHLRCDDKIRLAARYGWLPLVKFLFLNFKHFENVKWIVSYALTEAAANGHLEVVKFLTTSEITLEDGSTIISPFIKNCSRASINFLNNSPLRSASGNGYLEVVQYLISIGADYTVGIKSASENGRLNILKFLLEGHIILPDGTKKYFQNVNTRINIDESLIAAANNGHLEIVKYLIDKQIIPNNSKIQDINLSSQKWIYLAFLNAALNGHLEIVKYLTSRGVNPDIRSLILAIDNGHLDIIKYFMQDQHLIQNIDITAENNAAFIHAAENGHLEIIKYLMEQLLLQTGSLEKFRVSSDQALILATKKGHIEVVKYLVEGQLILTDDSIDKAVEWAIIYDRLNILKYLASKDADILGQLKYPLQTINKSFDMIQYLQSL